MSGAERSLISVVITTYEWPEALDAVLCSLFEQADDNFEVIVADDGSRGETAAVIARHQAHSARRLRHVWQPDEGWRRSRILDLAALEAVGDYLIFLDGDCLPRSGFLRAVRRARRAGWFLASKRLHLSADISRRVLEEHLPVWRWSVVRWLLLHPRELLTSDREAAGLGLLAPIRDRRRPWRPGQPEFFPPFDGYGFFLAVTRSDFERVNGFDLRFEEWGGEDVDIAVRLRRAGLRCGWPGPSATVLHLWHGRASGTGNRELLEATRAGNHFEAIEGVRELRMDRAAQVSANRVGSSSGSSDPV